MEGGGEPADVWEDSGLQAREQGPVWPPGRGSQMRSSGPAGEPGQVQGPGCVPACHLAVLLSLQTASGCTCSLVSPSAHEKVLP